MMDQRATNATTIHQHRPTTLALRPAARPTPRTTRTHA